MVSVLSIYRLCLVWISSTCVCVGSNGLRALELSQSLRPSASCPRSD